MDKYSLTLDSETVEHAIEEIKGYLEDAGIESDPDKTWKGFNAWLTQLCKDLLNQIGTAPKPFSEDEDFTTFLIGYQKE